MYLFSRWLPIVFALLFALGSYGASVPSPSGAMPSSVRQFAPTNADPGPTADMKATEAQLNALCDGASWATGIRCGYALAQVDRERSQAEAATWHAIALAAVAALACAGPVCVLLGKLAWWRMMTRY